MARDKKTEKYSPQKKLIRSLESNQQQANMAEKSICRNSLGSIRSMDEFQANKVEK